LNEVTRTRGVAAKNPAFECAFDSVGDGITTDYAGIRDNQQEQRYDQRCQWTGRLVRDEPAERI
jgi:hypothetical protein